MGLWSGEVVVRRRKFVGGVVVVLAFVMLYVVGRAVVRVERRAARKVVDRCIFLGWSRLIVLLVDELRFFFLKTVDSRWWYGTKMLV